MTGQVGTIMIEQLSEFEYRYTWKFSDVLKFPEFKPGCNYFVEYTSPLFKAMQQFGNFYFKLTVSKPSLQEDHIIEKILKGDYREYRGIILNCDLVKENNEQKSFVLAYKSKWISPDFKNDEMSDAKYFDKKSLNCCTKYIYNFKNILYGNIPTLVFTMKFPFVESPNLNQNISYVSDLTRDLKALYNTKIMSDVTIKVQDYSFDAHRCILSARSSVFCRMFEGNFTESQSRSIQITDCDVEVFKKFLKYLYTNELDDDDMESVLLLYSLSDKYDVQGLLMKCTKIIEAKIVSKKVANDMAFVCNVLKLAYHHDDYNLKAKTLETISDHFSQVAKTEEWKNILKKDVQLASEVLIYVSDALNCKMLPQKVKKKF